MNEPKRFTAQVAGHEIIIETGLLAPQAGGAVTVQSGESVVLCTATAAKGLRAESEDFFPLSVEFEERLYAAGRIPGSFMRREGRPSDEAILLCRLVDRPLRPLFPKGFRNEVQVILTALSADKETYLDILSIIGASAALMISDIPFLGPVGAVRVGYIDGQFVINPTASQMERSTLDLRLAGTEDAILMVEAGAHEIPEDVMLEAMRVGHAAMQDLIRVQKEMAATVGKPKMSYIAFEPSPEVEAAVRERAQARVEQILEQGLAKGERSEALDALLNELIEELGTTFDPVEINAVFEKVVKQIVRRRILDLGIRPDGRDAKTIRPVSCQVGLLPRVHGSGLFNRGLTQVLTIATLGTPSEAQTLDTLSPEETKRYLHHYNFPPYSTGEVWPLRGPKRREIGHGALAERALLPMIPPEDQFPYTIRLVSEVLSSNGSTSMASVCASTLALMDAGVPIKAPVAGVAMGLITDENGRYAILTDIQGIEDAMGDMDFKVAGTARGITALQMDIKIKGLSYEILEQALRQAREGRLFILDKMLQVIPEPRKQLSKYAPRIITIHIDPEKIGKVIGPGGKVIRKIQEEYDVKVDIEEDGTVFIAATDQMASESAVREIELLTEEVEVGKIYTGRVVRTEPYGAFVEILPGVDGMVHISQLADYRAPSVEDVVKVGDEIMVMVVDIDSTGKIRLSRQAVLEGWSPEEARERDRGIARGSRPSSVRVSAGRSSGRASGSSRPANTDSDRSRSRRR
ncbi:MAG: polyribonucleotide nucleotidyltransferase [Anaerolineae bacterium]|nr:polyribonucleotide nucleotidyltransferase [Anaerolineae bacterium]MDW8099863.1 polyribonucleotide nucleotidyltransferase [Anaerolineae bacterium]